MLSDLSAYERPDSPLTELQAEPAQGTEQKILSAGLISSFGFNVSFFLAFTWGAFQISTGFLTFGTFTAFLQLIGRIQNPIKTAGRILPEMASLLTSIDRYKELESLPSEPCDEPALTDSSPMGIRIRNLSFRYTTDQPVLDNITLTIAPGECITLLGPSGAGKTTFIRLLLQLIVPETGNISLSAFDGVSRTESFLPNSRSYFTYVPQGNTLLSGTIAENLLIGDPNATEEQL